MGEPLDEGTIELFYAMLGIAENPRSEELKSEGFMNLFEKGHRRHALLFAQAYAHDLWSVLEEAIRLNDRELFFLLEEAGVVEDYGEEEAKRYARRKNALSLFS